MIVVLPELTLTNQHPDLPRDPAIGDVSADPLPLPLCTVCIANYNGLDLLGPCIDSVLAQDCGFPVEIIVHDDCSTDASLTFLRERYPEVRILASDTNVGFCVSNNRMVAQAQGDFILLLNNDAWLAPDALRTLANHAQVQTTPGILGLAQYDAETGELVDIGSVLDPFYNPMPNTNPERRDVGHVIGACFWIPRRLWVELGGFPAWFHTLAEDLYLCCRARLAGYPVQALATSRFHHWIGRNLGGGKTSGPVKTSYVRRHLTERNKCFIMSIVTPGPLIVVLLPVHLVLLAAEGLLLSLVKRELGPWRQIYRPALTGFWAERRRVWAERVTVQASRRVTIREFLSAFSPIPFKLRVLLRHGLPQLG